MPRRPWSMVVGHATNAKRGNPLNICLAGLLGGSRSSEIRRRVATHAKTTPMLRRPQNMAVGHATNANRESPNNISLAGFTGGSRSNVSAQRGATLAKTTLLPKKHSRIKQIRRACRRESDACLLCAAQALSFNDVSASPSVRRGPHVLHTESSRVDRQCSRSLHVFVRARKHNSHSLRFASDVAGGREVGGEVGGGREVGGEVWKVGGGGWRWDVKGGR